ncbi:MAG: hypothetical protein ACRDGB_04465 [Candidatus Limnocylindria bacterium]
MWRSAFLVAATIYVTLLAAAGEHWAAASEIGSSASGLREVVDRLGDETAEKA